MRIAGRRNVQGSLCVGDRQRGIDQNAASFEGIAEHDGVGVDGRDDVGAGSEVLRLRTGHECAYAGKKKYESHGFIYQAHVPSAHYCTTLGESLRAASSP